MTLNDSPHTEMLVRVAIKNAAVSTPIFIEFHELRGEERFCSTPLNYFLENCIL